MSKLVLPPLILAVLLLTTGCGRGHGGDSQTVATGKDFDVTVPELEQVLRNAPPVTREEVVPARKAFLQTLINQKLLAKAALDGKLDRRPDVMQTIEAARRGILADAYVEELTSGASTPSGSAIAAYYDSHPTAYAERRRIDMDALAVPATSPQVDRYLQLFRAQGLEPLRTVLQNDGINASIRPVSITSDQLPSAAQIDRLSPGSNVTLRSGSNIVVGTVRGIVADPVTLQAARDAIGAQMVIDQKATRLKAEIDRLRAQREVHADYSKLGAAPKAGQ